MASVALSSGRIGVVQIPQIGRRVADDVVMVHGLGANLGFWYAGAVEWFRRFGRVTLFDLPGHGESEMPETGYSPATLAGTLADLLDELGVERAHLVAHSFGGSVALAFAAAYPKRVKSLVLADVRLWAVEPEAMPDESMPLVRRLRDAGLALADAGRDVSVQVLVELARLRLTHDQPIEEIAEIIPGARALFAGRRSARHWLRLIETTGAYAEMTDPSALPLSQVARVEAPVLALYGEQSACLKSAHAIQHVCRRCRIELIPEAGHFFPLTRPRLFARAALTFMQATARARRRRRRALARMEAEGSRPSTEAPAASHEVGASI